MNPLHFPLRIAVLKVRAQTRRLPPGSVAVDGRALFVTNLVDCIAGSLAAPVSDATLAAAAAKAAG